MKIIATNRKAYYNYFIEDTFQAGIVLSGSEVKSIRQGNVSLEESYVSSSKNSELFVRNFYIKPYEKSSVFVPNDRRDRKLLLNKSEINKLISHSKEKGFTIVPTKVYLKGHLVKLEIALAKGKHLYDKKRVIAERDKDRDLKRQLKHYN